MDKSQIGIGILGSLAIFLVSSKSRKISRWGFIVGLLSQPFWFYTAIMHKQWGIVILSLIYTISWIRGIWNFWVLPKFKKAKD